jgi:hypothetical protein
MPLASQITISRDACSGLPQRRHSAIRWRAFSRLSLCGRNIMTLGPVGILDKVGAILEVQEVVRHALPLRGRANNTRVRLLM